MKPAVAGYASGYVGVDSTATFTANSSYGFEGGVVDSRYGDHSCDDVVDRDDPDSALLRGAVRIASGTRFSVRLPPFTKVRIRASISSVPYWYSPGTTHYQLAASRIDDLSISVTKGSAGSSIVAADIDLRTPISKGSLTTAVGSYRKVWFTGTAGSDGVLRVGFFAPAGTAIPVAAIEIFPFVAPPLLYRRIGSAFVSSPTGATITGLTAFHAHDFETARQQFGTIADPLSRAYAFAFLAGWLDGDDDDFGDDLAACFSALDDSSLVTNPRAIELRDRAGDLARAEKHYRLRGFSWSYPLPPAGEGWFNPSDPSVILAWPLTAKSAEKHYYLAENLYAQAVGHTIDPLVALNAGAHTDGDFEASPFAFRSLERIAKIHTGMNPTHGYSSNGVADAGRLAALELAEDLFRDFETFGFLANEFAGNAELASLSYAARPEVHQHDLNGGLFTHWNGANISMAAFDPASAWWADGILEADTSSGAPPWADAQRRYLHAFRRAATWWLEDAQIDSEFGGGFGDDPELIGQLVLPFAALEHHDDEAQRDVLLAAASKTLESEWIVDGYYEGVKNDVEHTAEFTTYPLSVGLALRPDDPDLLSRCLDVARHLTSPNGDSVPWASPTPSGALRFDSYYFTSSGPPDPFDAQFTPFGVDVPLNARAMVPSLLFLGALENPTLENDLTAWLRSWRDLALTPTPGMPLGLVPATVRGDDGVLGNDGSWWLAPGAASAYSFPANMQSVAQLYAGFFGFVHDNAESDAFSWLLPALRMIQGALTLHAAMEAGNPPADVATIGTANWALAQLLASSDFWKLCAFARPKLATDPYLRGVDDPLVDGTAPYVNDAFLAALDGALSAHGGGYATHLAVPQGPIDVAGGTYGRKGKNALNASLLRGTNWLRNYFPLATTAVLYTDRAFLFSEGSHQTLYGMITGGEFGFGAPNHLCTWAPTGANDPPLDVAIVVNDFAAGADGASPRLRVLLFNFEDSPRDVSLRLWHRLPFGQYAMRHGTALSSTDYFANGVFSSQSIVFDERGDRFPFLLPSHTLTLLELERTGDAAPQGGFDVALSDSTESFALESSDSVLRVAVRATNFGDASIPAESFRVRISLDRPNGQPLAFDNGGAKQLLNDATLDGDVLPAFDGYDLPQADLSLSIDLPKVARDLIALGCTLEFQFESLVSDSDSSNDTRTLVLDYAKLAELIPDLTAQEPKGSAKKIEKLFVKKAKKLGKAWK